MRVTYRIGYVRAALFQPVAVVPDIVPAPDFHRSVVLLISSQGRIPAGRLFSFRGAVSGKKQARRIRNRTGGSLLPRKS